MRARFYLASAREVWERSLCVGDAEALIGRVVAGRYRITGVLGAGGMGVVYSAMQEPLGREVALKVLRPGILDEAFVKRFEREAQATSKVTHPRLVVVYDYGVDGALPYLVMERLSGRTLRDALRERGRLPSPQALAIARDVADGLAAAHDAGVIHRDLKPENVFLVAPRDDVKVLDFGIAKLLGSDGTQTATGMIAGTPGYVAPERFGDDAPVDARTDLYAVGVMFFEMVAGRLPFSATTPMGLAVAAMHETAPRLSTLAPDVAPEVDVVVAALLSRDPALRPANARALVHMIDALRRATPASSLAAQPSLSVAAHAPAAATQPTPAPGANNGTSVAAPTRGAKTSLRIGATTVAVAVVAVVAVAAVAALGVAWFKGAPPLALASCATDPALCVEEGRRAQLERNHGAAAKAWRAGCDGNVGDACVALAQAIRKKTLDGDELDVNVLLSRACDARAPLGCLGLGRLLEEGDQGQRALLAYERSCTLGSVRGCVHGAALFDVGSGELPASAAAVDALTADCDDREATACRALGLALYRRATIAADDAEKVRASAFLVRACALGFACERAHDPTLALVDSALAKPLAGVPTAACFPQGAVRGRDFIWMRFDVDARGRANNVVARAEGLLGDTSSVAACAVAALEKTKLGGGPMQAVEHVFF